MTESWDCVTNLSTTAVINIRISFIYLFVKLYISLYTFVHFPWAAVAIKRDQLYGWSPKRGGRKSKLPGCAFLIWNMFWAVVGHHCSNPGSKWKFPTPITSKHENSSFANSHFELWGPKRGLYDHNTAVCILMEVYPNIVFLCKITICPHNTIGA